MTYVLFRITVVAAEEGPIEEKVLKVKFAGVNPKANQLKPVRQRRRSKQPKPDSSEKSKVTAPLPVTRKVNPVITFASLVKGVTEPPIKKPETTPGTPSLHVVNDLDLTKAPIKPTIPPVTKGTPTIHHRRIEGNVWQTVRRRRPAMKKDSDSASEFIT